MSSDEELIAKINAITDPLEALKTMSENSHFVGSDPYYRDFDSALWEMVSRVINLAETSEFSK